MRDTPRDGQAVQMEPVGCRMMLIDGYVVESHVFASAVKRLLAKCSAIWGNLLLGIPVCSPGMKGTRTDHLSPPPSATAANRRCS
jgi:hypothetical protein